MSFYFNIKPLVADLRLPERSYQGDAGLDVFAREDKVLKAHERHLFKLGFQGQFPENYVCFVCSRSGLALKKGLIVLNAPGIIDSSYLGEYGVILFNSGLEDVEIKNGDKIAQLIFSSCLTNFQPQIADDLKQTDRDSGGFGSTDSKK